MAASLFGEGLPTLELLETILGRKVDLVIEQDNQATILVAKAGYSSWLRSVSRTHKVDLGSIKEVLDRDSVQIRYVASAEQAADIFTKAVAPQKWEHALTLLNIVEPDSKAEKPKVEGPASRVPPKSPEVPKSSDNVHHDDDVPLSIPEVVDISKFGVDIPTIHRGAMAVAEHGESIIRFNKVVRGLSAQACQFIRGKYALPIKAALDRPKALRERRSSGKLKDGARS